MLSIEYIPISDDPKLGIKRAVSWDSFSVLKKQKLVQLTTMCYYFEVDENQIDGYGKELKTQGLKPFEKTFFASNERKVNPANGKECKMQEIIVGQDQFGKPIRVMQMTDTMGNHVLNPMGQFDYFYFLIRNAPIIIQQIITSIIQEEDQHYKSFNN